MKEYVIRSVYETERTGVILDSEEGIKSAHYAEDCYLSPDDPYYEVIYGKGFSRENSTRISRLPGLTVAIKNKE